MSKKTVAERLAEIRDGEPLRRMADVGAINVEERTVELAFSSEEEYRRWWGVEILDHSPDSVDLSRLNNAAAVLWMHDWDDQRGVVESSRVESDRRGRAKVRFSKSPKGEELFQDVIDKIVTKVSVGYTISALKLVEEREDVDVYRVTSWQPYEISFVSVPADDTVGVGRSMGKPPEENTPEPADNTISKTQSPVKATKTMNVKDVFNASGDFVRAKVDDAGNIVEVIQTLKTAAQIAAESAQRGADDARQNVAAISALGDQYGRAAEALKFIREGKTADEFRSFLLADYAAQRSQAPLADQTKGGDIGMTDKEVKQFSVMKIIRALADPRDDNARKAAAFEIECSRAAAELYGKNPKGMIIPSDVLMRAFTTTNPTGGPGNNIIATELLSGSFIDLLRKRTWVMKRARTLAGLVGNVDIPRQNAAGSAYWVGEGGSPTSTQPGVDQIALTPKTIGATTDITRRLMIQSTPDAEALVRDDILKVIALEIDRAAIYGTGSSNMPKGLNNYTGLNAVAFATPGAPTFKELVQMETNIALSDADVDAMSYSANAAFRGYAKSTVKFSSAGSATIWEPGNTVNGYQTNISNQITAGDVFFGNWMDLIIAMWGGLELTVDPYSLSTSGGLRLVALQDIDINVRHVESFSVGR